MRRREFKLFQRPAMVGIVIINRSNFAVRIGRAQIHWNLRLSGFLVLFCVDLLFKIHKLTHVLLFAERKQKSRPTKIIADVGSVRFHVGQFSRRERAQRVVIIMEGQTDLANVIGTTHSSRGFARRLNSRQKQSDENSNDRDNN